MRIAITRSPGQELSGCELSHLARQPINFALARQQHQAYQGLLRDAGFEVIELSSDPTLPDGVFVEDTALVLDEIAIITSLTPPSRRPETVAIEPTLRPYRPIMWLPADAHLEGGDVLRVGKTLYVGLSARTNEAGVKALREIITPLGYSIQPISVRGCLHLKSACTALDDETILINRAWIDSDSLAHLRLIDVPTQEPWSANVLRLPDRIVMSAAYPHTIRLVERFGLRISVVDVTELHKAEGGLTCMSLLFESRSHALRESK